MKLPGILAVMAALVLAPSVRANDTPASWNKAVVYLPKSTEPTTIDGIPSGRKFSVAIYLHGCSGLAGGERGDSARWGKLLAQQDLLVVMPDSMARNDRKPSCDPATYRAGLFPPVYSMRLAELKYAAEQIRAQPWFGGKLLLMGHSEGGVTAARTPLPGFSGIVISGWTCTNARYPSSDGIFAPPDTPVLALKHEDDPWFPPGSPSFGQCEPKLAGRANSSALLLPGRGHSTYENAAARRAVIRFIEERLRD